MHNCGHCYCSRDMLPVHGVASSYERIQSARIKCSEWCSEILVVFVWVYWRNGQGLYLCRDTTVRRCPDGQVCVVIKHFSHDITIAGNGPQFNNWKYKKTFVKLVHMLFIDFLIHALIFSARSLIHPWWTSILYWIIKRNIFYCNKKFSFKKKLYRDQN